MSMIKKELRSQRATSLNAGLLHLHARVGTVQCNTYPAFLLLLACRSSRVIRSMSRTWQTTGGWQWIYTWHRICGQLAQHAASIWRLQQHDKCKKCWKELVTNNLPHTFSIRVAKSARTMSKNKKGNSIVLSLLHILWPPNMWHAVTWSVYSMPQNLHWSNYIWNEHQTWKKWVQEWLNN